MLVKKDELDGTLSASYQIQSPLGGGLRKKDEGHKQIRSPLQGRLVSIKGMKWAS